METLALKTYQIRLLTETTYADISFYDVSCDHKTPDQYSLSKSLLNHLTRAEIDENNADEPP